MNAFDPATLLRPAIKNLRPFSSGRKESSEVEDRSKLILLDTSENPWPPEGKFAVECRANRYPEPHPTALKRLFAGMYNVTPEQILLCRGSEELPDILIRSICQPAKEGIVICPPTFGVYEVSADINEAIIRRVPLREKHCYDLDVDAILGNWKSNEKIIFIASPAAPMGHLMPAAQIETIIKALSDRAIVAVDEAYVEFSGQPSWIEKINQYPHLIVMRTLSKAFGLAGARLGAMVAAPSLVAKLEAIFQPYPFSAPMIEVVLQALTQPGLAKLDERRAVLISERKRMSTQLAHSPMIQKVFPSDSNFVLVQTANAAAFVEHCRKNGIIVRSRHNDLPQTVRISMGTPEQNDQVLQAVGVNSGRARA